MAGISNDGPDQKNVIIRHIESFKKGSATRLIMGLLERGCTIETGKPNYNSISPSAYHLFNKIDRLSGKSGLMSEKTGQADNTGKGYAELEGVDVQHFRWKKR